MTRREITNTSKETEIATRRSARTKALPAEVKSSKTTPKITKTPKSRKNVVDSEDEIAQDQEEEEEEEEKLERRPRRGASTRSSKDAKAAPITKKPTKNGNNASGSIPVQKTVESQTEEHEEEDDEDEDEDEDEEEEESSEEEDDTGSDFEEPSSKQKAKAGAKKSRQPKASTSRIPVIKPRKSTASTPKTPKVAKASRSSKSSAQPKQSKAVNTTESDLEGDAEEESELYSAVLDSQAALDTVVADWITLYERSSDEAMLNLTNFLIRCCGCKQFVTAEDFKDTDKMVDTLEGILLRYKKTTVNFDYPIVSKAKEFKKFRKNLLEFYSRLIQKTKSDILFDGVFMDTLLDWTISLSSSTFRPVRHTATTVALNIITSLAEIDTAVKEDLDLKGRQLKTSQKQKSAQVTKQLQKEITKGKNHEESVLKWIKEIFSSVYVLRCRDVDPLVRTDCIHELGQWMVLNSKVFIDTQYLRYIGMVLSDRVATVRLEALKVLAKLYEMENQPSQLQQFTTRSTSRFVEMAISESDTSARLAAIRVATLVHKHNYLEEEDLANLGALIFGANAKVRKSLAKFVKARVWESEVEGRMANCDMIAGDGVDVRKDWIELRSLVSFLIKVCKTESESADSDAQDDERADISGTRLFDETKVGRITLAAEALWSEIEVLKNWKSIAEYLLEDHTRPVAPSSSKNGKANTVTLEDIYHLEEEEENVLLEIFIASLQMTLNPPPVPGFQKDKARIKAQQDDLANEVGRFCVDIIPKLFLKYSVDAARVRFVLTIPQLIPLNVYLDMRMLAAYEEVVDEVIKVFKKHSDPSVLSTAVMTIRAMQGYEILRSSHEAKIDALGANVVDTFLTQFSQSQDSDISDRNTLEELTLCLRRLEHLIKCTDVTVKRIRSTDQDPFEGLLKVAQRYRAVNGQDAEILISALSISFLWISWVCRDTASKYDQNADWKEEDVQDILYMQESLVRIVSDFTANNSKDIDARVRRRAFQILGDIYWLFGGDMFHASKGPNRRLLYMTCSESVQTECETFLRSELDLWNEKVREKMRSIQAARPSKTTEDGVQAENNDSDAEGSDLRENEAEALEDEKLAAAQIEQEDKYEMFGTVFSFMRQIMLKDFTMEHSTAVIARYGCFGAEYDEGVKRVVTSIKAQTTEGASKQSRDQKAETFMRVCLDSVNESIEIYLNGHVKSSNQALQLARLLATAIKPPGFMQSTRTGIDSRLVWDLHRRGIVFSLGKIAEYQRTGDTKKNKMVKYFDVLSNIPFGTQTAANESSSILELIKEECEKGGLEVTNDDVWEPLRYYQSKLEKLIHRAAAEQATAVKKTEIAARLREEQQQQLQDVDMTIADQEQPTTEPTVETNEPLQSTNGKKRQAEDDEDEIDEEEVATEEVEGSNEVNNSSETELSRDGSVDRDIQTKESKRIRVR